jgi:hypothetical protein
VNWRFWRHLLIVFGAYSLAISVLSLLMGAHMLAHIGVSYTDNVVSEAFAAFVGEFPRAIAAALAMVLIWYALGPALARRWMWALAGLFTFFSLSAALQVRFLQHVEYGWMAVRLFLPGAACVLTELALQRVAPGEGAISDETTPQQGRTVALVVACSALAMIVGGAITTLTFMSLMPVPCK